MVPKLDEDGVGVGRVVDVYLKEHTGTTGYRII